MRPQGQSRALPGLLGPFWPAASFEPRFTPLLLALREATGNPAVD